MRLLAAIASLLPLLAQTPPAAPATPAAPTEQTNPAPAVAAESPSPVPPTESWFNGSIDFGYRWLPGVGGSLNTYRTFVDLGSGPKLIGADFTITDPKHRAFDQMHVRATSWGDDPYEAFHLDAKKSKVYDFNADYRDMAYFNLLPSYADPLLARGILLDEQSFDTRRRIGSFRLDLLPGNWFIPYVAYDRDSGGGTGETAFVDSTSSYPVPNTMRDLTNLYRGGVRFELRRFHATLEEGGTTFKNDQSVYQNPGSANYGNVSTPLLGQTLDLSTLLAAYGIRGDSVYSKALFTANATSWLDLYGQFLYSQPDTSIHYQQTDTGNLLLQNQLLFYSSEAFLLSAAAKLPHTTASFGGEIRPFHRLRIVESWLTDRLHNSGSAASTQILAGLGGSQQMAALLTSSLVTNYNQQETDVLYDLTSKIMLRGGYRYVWGEANDAILPPEGLMSSDQAKLRRNVGLGAVTFRLAPKLSLTGEAEVGSSGGAYFRTSLYDYQKVRAQARYQAIKSLNFTADLTLLQNNNPTPGVNYNYVARQESLSLFWAPGKIWDFEASFTRSDLRSDLGYLVPQDLSPQTSLYHDNANTATVLFNIKLPHGSGVAPKLTAGGSMFISTGSLPTSYFQPIATLWLPLGKRANWFTEWRYYGYGEVVDFYQGFRSHLVTTGLRLTL